MKNRVVRDDLISGAAISDRGWRDLFAWISVLWLVLTSGGAYYNSAGVINVVLLASVAVIALQFSCCWKAIEKKHGSVLLYAALAIALILLSMIANGDFSSFLSYARIAVVVLLSLSTVVFLGVDRFLLRSFYVILMVSLISLVLFYLQVLPGFSSYFPSFVSNEYSYLNAFVYSEIDGVERRNAGPFIEPGLFQVYINFALALLLFDVVRVRAKNLYILVLLGAVFSTNSTTGFIVALATVLLSLGMSEKGRKFENVMKYALLLGGVAFVFSSDYVISNIEDKFTNDVNMSFVTRFNSTLIDLAVIEDSPVFGGGAGGYGSQLSYYDARGLVVDAATNTFTQLGAYVGVVLVLLLVFRGFLFFIRAFRRVQTSVAFVFWYVISFSTEPFLFFPFFYVFPFLSFFIVRADERR